MSGLPVDPMELDALASEYVLGTLDARMAKRVADALPSHVALAALVHDWEMRLAPLTDLAVPEAPPADLWNRIEQAISPVAVKPVVRPSRFRLLWQGWAIGATIVAAALAAVTVLPARTPPAMMTVLLSDANQTAWTAEVGRDGGIHLAALPAAGGAAVNTAPPDNKVLELWQLPPGATAPTSLGVVPRGQSQVTVARPAVAPVPGMLILISLEPSGGAPDGKPTGPVLFVGRLNPAGPAI